jgi:hypothetical protein
LSTGQLHFSGAKVQVLVEPRKHFHCNKKVFYRWIGAREIGDASTRTPQAEESVLVPVVCIVRRVPEDARAHLHDIRRG